MHVDDAAAQAGLHFVRITVNYKKVASIIFNEAKDRHGFAKITLKPLISLNKFRQQDRRTMDPQQPRDPTEARVDLHSASGSLHQLPHCPATRTGWRRT